jgi:DNA polymerase elongation subunit (family B)
MEVIEIIEVTDNNTVDQIVYDLETEVGTFVAGGETNGILVKNTDSDYVKFPIERSLYATEEEFMNAQFKMAIECASYCTERFKPPIELEFEKFMYPLMLIAKKRYIYKEWVSPKEPSGIEYKGVQIVRRDTCKFVKEELSNIVKLLFDQKDMESGLSAGRGYTEGVIKKFLDGDVDQNKLILSKQLKGSYKVRKNNITKEVHWTNPEIKQPHVRLAQILKTIDPVNSPKPPDRVPYLFIEKKPIRGQKVVLQCDKVIHPDNFEQGVHKLDSLYYFDHQFKKPLDMIFQFMMKNTEDLYRRVRRSKINQVAGQKEITSFFKVKEISEPIIEEISDSESDSYSEQEEQCINWEK